MDTAQLSAWFTAHKSEALLVGGAAVAGLALLRKKKSAAGGSTGVTAGAVAPGTMPAGAVVPAGSAGGSYDSTSFDLYNALQDEIGTIAHQNEANGQTGAGGSGVAPAVGKPIASGLFAPTWSGQLGRWGDTIGEIESDGSVLRLNADQLNAYAAHGTPTTTQLSQNKADMPASWSVRENLAGKYPQSAAAPKP